MSAPGTNQDREAWVVDYVDQHGKRRLKTFTTKKDAEAWKVNALHEVQHGIHTAVSASITVAEAAENWLTHVEREGRERATLAQYRQHVHKHINPRLGNHKLAALTTPRANLFREMNC